MSLSRLKMTQLLCILQIQVFLACSFFSLRGLWVQSGSGCNFLVGLGDCVLLKGWQGNVHTAPALHSGGARLAQLT